MEGFIKLFRKITEWEWYTDANVFRVFVHLMLKANYTDKRWQGIEIKRGQCVTSTCHLASELKMTRNQVRLALDKLQRTGEISVKTTNKFTLVTLLKYGFYQDMWVEDNQQTTNKPPTDNHQNTNKPPQHNKENKDNKDNKEITTTISSGDDDILTFYCENISEPKGFERDMLLSYKSRLSDEVMRYAIEQAVLNGKRNCGYVLGVCKRLMDEEVKSPAQLERHKEKAEEQRRRKGQQYTNGGAGCVYSKGEDPKRQYMKSKDTYTDRDLFDDIYN